MRATSCTVRNLRFAMWAHLVVVGTFPASPRHEPPYSRHRYSENNEKYHPHLYISTLAGCPQQKDAHANDPDPREFCIQFQIMESEP